MSATVIDTFIIEFKTQITDAIKGMEELQKANKDLESKLEKLDVKTKKIGKSFFDLAKAAAELFAVKYAADTIFGGIAGASEHAAELGRVSQALGVNVEQLDAWGKAVQRTGGTAESFGNSLKGLAEHLGGNAQIALKILPQLADVFQKIGRIRSFQYGKALGLDESTILLLQQGRREVEAQINRQRELGVVTKEDTEIGIKYKQAIQDTSNSFDNLFRVLGRDIIPGFTKFLEKVSDVVDYLAQHKDFVIGTFIAIGIATTAMLAPWIAANASIILLGIGLALLIALFGIAYEDIKHYINGQSSLLGDIINKYPLAAKAVKELTAAYKELLNIFENLDKYYGKLGEFSAGFFNKIGLGKSLEDKVSAYFSGAENTPFNSLTSSNIFSSTLANPVQNINVGDVTINTQSSDPIGIADHFRMGIRNQVSQAMNQFSNGVAY